jgi:cyclopropane fatty-acyl-phospholipid synthase-like methyltransferase
VLLALGERGLRGSGIDISAEAVDTCRRRIVAQHFEDRLRVEEGDLFALRDDEHYDLAIAFEVLEHIEDDRGALDRVRALLTPRGHFLLSVPAHQRKWGATDVWAGHVRRYERAELLEKLAAADFDVVSFRSYGFPLLNITRAARNLVYARSARHEETAVERSAHSATALPGPVRRLRPVIPAYAWLVYQTQRPFLGSDLGEGYFVLARRRD